MPVRMPARAGVQDGTAEYAREKRNPRSASASRLGVSSTRAGPNARVSASQPRQSPRCWSVVIRSKLGRTDSPSGGNFPVAALHSSHDREGVGVLGCWGTAPLLPTPYSLLFTPTPIHPYRPERE